MGAVTFHSNVEKTVDITKTVDLGIEKNIFADVNLEGALATATASADTLATSIPPNRLLLIDNFIEPRQIVDLFDLSSTPFGAEPIPRIDLDPSSTNLPIADDERAGQIEWSDATTGNITFISGDEFRKLSLTETTDASIELELIYGNQDPFASIFTPFDFSPFALMPSSGLFLTVLETTADLSVAIRLVELGDPNAALVAFKSVPAGSSNETLFFPFSSFIDPDPTDQTNISDFDLIALQVNQANGEASGIFRFGDFFVGNLPLPIAAAVIAETDTFTQVSEAGAFAFAESLSALSFEETDTLIF